MVKMNKEEKKIIENEVEMILRNAVGSQYARYILEHENEKTGIIFMEDVIEDVMCASAWDDKEYYNDDDIRLSIGRIFIERLGIEV